jgi:predicted enzyme related to lactoylglutathione lyase
MTKRPTPPAGAPCWADLWTSDVPGARRFYGELFGWESEEPDPQFGGYFSFLRGGSRIAGCMGDMGDLKADNTWKIYLATDDITKTVETAAANGAQIRSPAMAVADLGSQAVTTDPTGAALGFWQPGTHPGFTVLGEDGAPSWFELATRDYPKAVAFYRALFPFQADEQVIGPSMRYTVLSDAAGELAGIEEATFLPAGSPGQWFVYWHADDVDQAVAKAQELGGTVVREPQDTPYGRLATLADPSGAQFKLSRPPKA